MRNIGIIIVLVLWILLGWKMCTDYSRCCDIGQKETSSALPLPVEPDKCSEGIICFADNSCDANYNDGFENFRDSIISLITADKALRITGIFNSSETYEGSASSLGACRADAVRTAFPGLRDEQIATGGQAIVGRTSGPGERISFEVFDLTPDVIPDDIGSEAIIYFPFNSTNKLNSSEIEDYLRKVASNVKGTGQRIRLTGHTDDIGTAASNRNLGQRRANIVADYLFGQGVRRNQIISESKGESDPVVSNGTEEGRARNRRTELQIIK